MMDGIILAALALLSVPVLLIVILVKVCGLENKVADLTKKVGVIDFTQSHVTAAQAGLAIRSEPSRAERVPRERGVFLGVDNSPSLITPRLSLRTLRLCDSALKF